MRELTEEEVATIRAKLLEICVEHHIELWGWDDGAFIASRISQDLLKESAIEPIFRAEVEAHGIQLDSTPTDVVG